MKPGKNSGRSAIGNFGKRRMEGWNHNLLAPRSLRIKGRFLKQHKPEVLERVLGKGYCETEEYKSCLNS